MVAYVIVVRERTSDRAPMAQYTPKAKAASVGHPLTIRALHGRHEVLEGPGFETMSLLEFPTFEAAKAWYTSPAYQEALPIRLKSGDFRCFIVEGV